jgi:hypothetical protein
MPAGYAPNLCAIEGAPHPVRPPSSSIGRQTAEVPALTAGALIW